jgi:hypothetical protein
MRNNSEKNISTKEGYFITKVPFQGFYESIYSDYDFSINEDSEYTEQEKESILDSIDHKATQENIASQYVYEFSNLFEIPLKFESMTSPREYNFETDKIYAYIPTGEVKRLLSLTKPETLALTVKDRFTSSSGFISFYDNDVNNWNWENPDHNMIETLIMAYISETPESEDYDLTIYERLNIYERIKYKSEDKAQA